jgi:hypothetical protein
MLRVLLFFQDMKQQSGPSRSLRAVVALTLALLLLPISALSQQRRRGAKTPSAQSKSSERVQRALAISLLVETADKARTFDDLFYRARIQTLAADALWPNDTNQARAIFRRAWEAAAASDKADHEEALREAGALPGALRKTTEARDEVLKAAARRDARLAEIFLRDLMSEKDERGANGNEAPRRTAWRELSAQGARRLALAEEMLTAGETRRAIEVATPLLNEGVSASLIAFILRLRDRSMSDGDTLLRRLLERAAADVQTDANAVLLLSSPFVSPGLMVVVDEFGSLQFRVLQPPKAYAAERSVFTGQTWAAFYSLAASVLSRPLPKRDELTMQDLVARFYATGRLLPLFENSSEPHTAAAPILRARHSELFNELEAGRREQLSAQFGSNSMKPAGYVDPLRSQAAELAGATDAAERERLALSIVRTATRNKFWDRARRAAAEIENAERRQSALSFIQVHQIKDILHAYEDQQEDDFESIAKFVREADVPPFAKAWGFAQTAVIAARKKEARATQMVADLINEAETQAARVALGRLERVAAYGALVTIVARLDAGRAWTLLRELVKAANAVEDFTGDDAALDLTADENSVDETLEQFSVEAEIFRLDGIFATMAHLDFDRALAEARALDGDVPQAFATIAGARARLEKQNSEGRSQKP